MSTWDKRYTGRVQLLVDILPVLAREPRFALKGGTAINLPAKGPELSAEGKMEDRPSCLIGPPISHDEDCRLQGAQAVTTTPHPAIRPEAPGDAEAIEAVTVAAFRDEPRSDPTEQHIVRALRAAGALTESLVAVCDGEVVGHVAASPVMLSDGTLDWFGLGPVSVLPKSGTDPHSLMMIQCARLSVDNLAECALCWRQELG